MRIAQVSPLYESVPPKTYGGTERVVSYLTEELVKQGHEVSLFASGDSETSARLVSSCSRSLRLKGKDDPLAYHILQMQDVIDHKDDFDLIHFHTDYLYYAISGLLSLPNLTTLHGRLDIPVLQHIYHRFSKRALVSISDEQRRPLPMANWKGTVYHGLPLDLYSKGDGKGNYVAFLGRISPEKRVDRAIAIARKAGLKIKIAAKIDKADESYYVECIQDLMKLPHVEFLGEINEHEKEDLLGNAKAVLFPIDWPEPFGLVMIEAMACGTPVIAFENGSVPEIIDSGETGFIVQGIDEAVQALKRVDIIDRDQCRATFERRFSVSQMASRYSKLYLSLMEEFEAKALPYVPDSLKQINSASFLLSSNN